jgi:hypothetical protein
MVKTSRVDPRLVAVLAVVVVLSIIIGGVGALLFPPDDGSGPSEPAAAGAGSTPAADATPTTPQTPVPATPTATTTQPTTTTSSTQDEGNLTARIAYDGEWRSYIDTGAVIRSVDGEGARTIDIADDADVLSVSGNKFGEDEQTLRVEIRRDGEVVQQASTSEPRGSADVRQRFADDVSYDGIPDGANVTVRVEYTNEYYWSVDYAETSRSADRSSPVVYDVPDDIEDVRVYARKYDESRDPMTVQVLADGEVIAEATATLDRGVARVIVRDRD